MGGKMTNLLNEEIMAIKHTIACLKKGEVLEPNPSKRAKMKNDIKELNDFGLAEPNSVEIYGKAIM